MRSIYSFLPDRFFDPDAIYGMMIDRRADPAEDAGTFRVASFLYFIDMLIFRRTRFTRFYLWRWKLWNSALVEGTGIIIYYLGVPICLNMLFVQLPFAWAWFLTSLFITPISFLTKFMIYNRWLFKKPDLSYLEEED